jgi:hypothetical protein
MVMTWGEECPLCNEKGDCHKCKTNKHPTRSSEPVTSEAEKAEEDPVTLEIAKKTGCLLDGNRVELRNFNATFKIFGEHLYLIANENKKFQSIEEFVKETINVEDIDDSQYDELIIKGEPWKQFRQKALFINNSRSQEIF